MPDGRSVAWRLVLTALVLAALAAVSCRWRAGREVWVDGGPDAATDGGPRDAEPDPDVPDDGAEAGCPSATPGTLGREELLAMLWDELPGPLVLDLRDAAACALLRIPGALCIPWSDGSFLAPLPDLVGADLVVLYGSMLSPELFAAAHALPLDCAQRALLLEDGFLGWLEADFEVEGG